MSEHARYDAAGRIVGRTDFNGYETTFQYDAMDRLLARVPDPRLGEPTVSFTYTPTGQRASMTDAMRAGRRTERTSPADATAGAI